MDQTRTIGRSSSISRRTNRSRRSRNEALAYSRLNGFSAQGWHSNEDTLPSLPQTQVSVAGISGDGKPMEVSSNKSFIFKLYDMLEDESISAYIHWDETGDSIIIPDIEEFKNNALWRYFGVPFESFHRQLNGYSFKKTNRASTVKYVDYRIVLLIAILHQSTTTGTYKHKESKFRRGCQDSLRDIKRSDTHQGKTTQQDQPAIEAVNDSDPLPPSQPDDLSDPWSKVSDLEQQNISLKTELREMKDALADLSRRHSRTEAALEELQRKFEAFSFPPSTALGGNSHIHEDPLPAPFNPPGVASYSGSAAQRGLTDMRQMMIADQDQVTGAGTQGTLGVLRPPVNALFQHPHYTTPAAALPPQLLGINDEPSPPSSAVRLPADLDLPPSVTIPEGLWLGSCPSVCQPMHLDSGTFAGVSLQSSTAPFTRPSRGSPRALNIPTMVVQRRQPRDDIANPGSFSTSSHSSQTWSAFVWR